MTPATDSAPALLTPGRCVRCNAVAPEEYLCAPCAELVEQKREAMRSRDALEDSIRRMRESELSMRYRSGDASLETYEASTRGQKAALAAVTAWVEGRAERPWLYLFGPVGTGKTHLAAAALHEVIRRGGSGRFVSLVDLLGRMRRSYQSKAESDYDILEPYRLARHLVVDDLGTERPSAWSIQVLTDLVNTRYESRRPTLFTSNYSLAEIGSRLSLRDEEVAAERIVDRVSELTIPVPVDGESYRQRRPA